MVLVLLMCGVRRGVGCKLWAEGCAHGRGRRTPGARRMGRRDGLQGEADGPAGRGGWGCRMGPRAWGCGCDRLEAVEAGYFFGG